MTSLGHGHRERPHDAHRCGVEGVSTDFAGRQHGIVIRRQLVRASLSVTVVASGTASVETSMTTYLGRSLSETPVPTPAPKFHSLFFYFLSSISCATPRSRAIASY
jgi:hypothetical protein